MFAAVSELQTVTTSYSLAAGASVGSVSIRFPDVVTVRWRREGDEEAVGAWVFDDDVR